MTNTLLFPLWEWAKTQGANIFRKRHGENKAESTSRKKDRPDKAGLIFRNRCQDQLLFMSLRVGNDGNDELVKVLTFRNAVIYIDVLVEDNVLSKM